MENFKDGEGTSLFSQHTANHPRTTDDAGKVFVLNGTGSGFTPQIPLALVAKTSDSERSVLESERGGLRLGVLRQSLIQCLQRSDTFVHLTFLNILKMNPHLVVSGLILLRRHLVSPPLNNAFREWREAPHLSTLFSQTQHVIPHCKKNATSHSFPLMAQAWWQSPNEPMAIVHVKTPDGKYVIKNRAADITGRRSIIPSRGSVFGPVQRIMRRNPNTCRWGKDTFLQLFKLSKIIKFYFASGTSHEMLIVTSPLDHRLLHPRGLVPKLLGLRCQFCGDSVDDKFY